MRSTKLLAIASVVLLAACGGSTRDQGGGGGDGAGELRVAIAFDVGGLGDQSFNDAAHRGLQQAIQEGILTEANTELTEPNATGSNRDDNVVNLADQGFDLVVAAGYAFSEGIAEIAADYPDQDFAVVDGFATAIATDAPNIVDLTFKEEEGSFLVGAAAAMATKTGTIGFLGGQEGTGLIEKFQAGYTAGARHIDPGIEVLVEYIGDDVTAFNDPTKGEALASKLYDEGADVVYHAAGASGSGLFQAAVAAGPEALAIGVDSDQYLTASPEQQPHILTSMLKKVETATYDTIVAVANDEFESGFRVFSLADGGMDYSKANPDLLTEDIQAQMEELKQQIIDGDIVPPETPEA
ncbi:MAG: BMP family lipoprotein [Actinomycetota bacterium]